MLTKNLVRYRVYRNGIHPKFIDVSLPAHIETAERLLAVFQESAGKTREQLLSDSKLVIDTADVDAVISRGLEKLLLDRTEFNSAPDEALMAFRQEVFAVTDQLLSNNQFEDLEAYRKAVRKQFAGQTERPDLAAGLYADLPAYQEVLRFKGISAERLLQRYNCAQVQGLLIHCSKLSLSLPVIEAAAIRQLFKYLRFQQLLADIQKDDGGTYRIDIDGPLSLFYQTQKYGLSLALFFPAVLHQQQWQLTAEIGIRKRRTYQLELDQDCGLKPYSHRYLAYVPENIRLFQTLFHEKVEDWQLETAGDFVPLGGDRYCFPDFQLRHQSGRQIALELFHPWHASHLTDRLLRLEGLEADPPLVIGVSTALTRDAHVAAALEASGYFQTYGFTFRDMPTVGKLTKVLKTFNES